MTSGVRTEPHACGLDHSAHDLYCATLDLQSARERSLCIDTATISYFGGSIGRPVGLSLPELRHEIGDAAFLSSTLHTPHGTAGIITIPMSPHELVSRRPLLRTYLEGALQLAAGLGASCISLAGILAAVLGYGRDIENREFQLTTGHATAAASVLLGIQHALTSARRAWQDERVAVVGVGSIGQAVIRPALSVMGAPARLIASDLAVRQPIVDALARQLAVEYPTAPQLEFCASGGAGSALYDASLVVGASSTPRVLDIARVPRGCIIVDDSVPHCFNVETAIERVEQRGDVLFTNGGMLRMPAPFPTRYFAPEVLHHRLNWPCGDRSDSELASCVLSPLLAAHEAAITMTLDQAPACKDVLRNHEVLGRLGISAALLRCDRFAASPAYVEHFATLG